MSVDISLGQLRNEPHCHAVVQARNLTRDKSIAGKVQLAFSAWQRTRGLIGQPQLRPGDGMLIYPCRGVHTCGMRYVIDVAFLDETGQVLACAHALRPWRISRVVTDATCVLELPGGTLRATTTEPGDSVAFQVAG